MLPFLEQQEEAAAIWNSSWRRISLHSRNLCLTLHRVQTKGKTRKPNDVPPQEKAEPEQLLDPHAKELFESMKRKLTKMGRSRKNPDMESDTEGNMQFKPLTHDQESSLSEELITRWKAPAKPSARGAASAWSPSWEASPLEGIHDMIRGMKTQ